MGPANIAVFTAIKQLGYCESEYRKKDTSQKYSE